MPIISRQDAADVEQYIARFFAATGAGRMQAMRQLFMEKLDFSGATGAISLANAPRNVALPASAERIAFMEGLQVVYVPLSGNGPDRVRKAEASAAAKLIVEALHGDLLLVMTNPSCSQLHVIYPTFVGAVPSLRRMIIERNLPRMTAVQQLSNIYWQWKDTGSILLALDRAFDVEVVTKQFFEEYKRVFERTLAAVQGFGPSKAEEDAKRLFVQTLFNRLMFIYFLSRKGWLNLEGDPDYLNALRKDYHTQSEDKNFYVNRLKLLFFAGLNNEASRDVRSPVLASMIGDVPFLNGGLFEETPDDKQPNILVPDAAIDQILRELFDKFNFTVMESTPFDVEVAVDPEMLGKVFEELVTGRHESGSYYTPRPVVSFMCREALKGYLESQNTGASTKAIAAFVDHKDTSNLTLASAPKVGEALAKVKVVDPACGSGAYLLGMMQELVELMITLYSAQLSHQAQDLYNLKLGIIQQNLYGADIDQFAVNIAMLRLWLSLAIDYDGQVPPPLPNLNFKIVCGDSLLGPDPSPENYGTLFRHRVHQLAGQLAILKDKHMRATGQEKANLTKDIESLKAQLREALEESAAPEGAVDWRVEYAEVFDQNGGFDVVIANPPYVRQEEIGPNKPRLRQLYPSAVTGKSDLYCYFYARAVQLLRNNGMHGFVCSNSWLDVGYGAKLQEFLLETTWIRGIYDSAVERQFSTAAINTVISIIQKSKTKDDNLTCFVSLRGPFDAALADSSLRRLITINKGTLFERGSDSIPEVRKKYVGDKWGGKYLRSPDIFTRLQQLSGKSLVPLGTVAQVRFGLKSGANEFFYLSPDDVSQWCIENEFLSPILVSPRELSSIIVQPNDLHNKAFICNVPKDELTGTKALEYIRWGESKGFSKRPTCAARPNWYSLGKRQWAQLLWPMIHFSRPGAYLNPSRIAVDHNLFEIVTEYPIELWASLFWIGQIVIRELTGRANLGEGALKTEGIDIKQLLVVRPELLTPQQDRISDAITAVSKRPVVSVAEEAGWNGTKVYPRADRQEIDNLIADVVQLTSEEREALYVAACELVNSRASKANSV